MAIGLIREAEGSLSVPSELSVIGFDDVPLSRFVNPPLTTIRISQSELARLAFHALVDDFEPEAESMPRDDYTLPTELVLRGTTALLHT